MGKATLTGRKAIHKGSEVKFVKTDELENYLVLGWILGKGQGTAWNSGTHGKQTAWNKGIPMSEDAKKKSSISHTGYKRSKESIKKMVETREKLGINKHSDATKEKLSKSLTGHTVSDETRRKISEANKGKSHPMSEEVKKKISVHNSSIEFQKYQREVKLKNGTINSSKQEKEFIEKLVQIFGEKDVISHFCDTSRYPFECDCYVQSLDLFIELNFHWTHGFHRYDANNNEDLLQLSIWKSKQKMYINSKGILVKNSYFVAEEVWTVRDPLKIKTAKENNLNYLTFYSVDEANDWIIQLKENKDVK